MTLEFAYANGGTLEVFKNPTTIVGGTPVIPVNNNSNSIKTSVLSIIKGPTSIADDGIRAAGFLAGGNRTAGFNQRSREVILEQGSILAGSNELSYCAEWYEHTNK